MEVKGKSLSIRDIDEARIKLIRDVEKTASNLQILAGLYVVSFLPFDPTIWKSSRRYIEKSIIDYIRRTKTALSPSEEIISVKGQKICIIHKTAEGNTGIMVGASSIAFQSEEKAKGTMCLLLNNAIMKQSAGLLKFSLPKILLLLDENYFLDVSHYRMCLPILTSQKDFHTIFIINVFGEADKDYILHTVEPDWQ